MNSAVLPAIAGEIQMHMDTIEKLKASIQIELDEIKVLETMRDSYFKIKTITVPDVPAVPVEKVPVVLSVVKPSASTVLVIKEPIAPVVQVIEKQIAHDLPVKKSSKKTVVTQDSLLPTDDYSSVDKKPKVLSNDKKLTDCDFDIRHLFDVKCIHKEKINAKYNLYYEGQLLHWINEKGEYSSTYKSGTNFTPFGPHNDDPFKASLFGRTNQRIKGEIYFGKQSELTSKPTSAKTSEHTSAKTSELNMEDVSVFPSLSDKK